MIERLCLLGAALCLIAAGMCIGLILVAAGVVT